MMRSALATVELSLAAESVAESLSEIAVGIDDVITRAVALSLGQQRDTVRDTVARLISDIRHFDFLLDCAFHELDEAL